jgi:hypothetical protein
MAKSDFHCGVCKNVGGRSGRAYKCHKHKMICSDCVTSSGFLTVRRTCRECDKEVLKYEFNEKKSKWEQV